MKSLFYFLLLAVFCSSCNFFDILDPNGNHADRCRQEADKHNYDKAIAECTKADPARTDVGIQVELGDIYLARAGITLEILSSVFLDTTHSTSLIIDLADSILEKGEVTAQKKADALSAIEAFDLANNQFYSTLSRLCYITMLIAYTDNDGRGGGEADGVITQADLCNDASCSVVCVENAANTACDGMTSTDANAAATELMNISTFLSEMGLGNLDNTLENMFNTEVPDPTVIPQTEPPTMTTIGVLTGASQGDAVRKLFWQMAE